MEGLSVLECTELIIGRDGIECFLYNEVVSRHARRGGDN